MFSPFLTYLSQETDRRLTVRDHQRLRVALRASGAAPSLGRLRQVMACVLTSSPEQRRQFDRQFDRFFSHGESTSIDLTRAWGDLQTLLQLPIDPAERSDVSRVPEPARLQPGPRPADRRPPPPPEPVFPFQLVEEIDMIPDEEEEAALRAWAESVPPANYRERSPSYFHWGLVCPRINPLLTPAQLDEAADSLGFYRSESWSRWLDVPATIRATIDQGGLPTLRLLHRRSLFSLVLLIDRNCRALVWNSTPDELAEGMRMRGVSVRSYWFHGTLDRLVDDQGRSLSLEDLEDDRQGLITLIVSDGRGMYRRRLQRPLERLSRWPRVAWLDPRDPQHWEGTPEYCQRRDWPLYAASGPGVIACLRRFSSEVGAADRLGAGVRRTHVLRGQFGEHEDAAFLSALLTGDLLRLAQACSLPTSISLGLADRMRREFFPGLSDSALDRLLSIPETQFSSGGLRFAPRIQYALCNGFKQQPRPWQQSVARFLQKHLVAMVSESEDPTSGRTLLVRLHGDLIDAFVNKDSESLRPISIAKVPALSQYADRLIGGRRELLENRRLRKAYEIRVTDTHTTSHHQPTVPEGWAKIHAGPFLMGDPSEQGDSDERPQHQVFVSEFYLEKVPVTKSQWDEVYAWAVKHGYQFENKGTGQGDDHPVQTVCWYDAVKWANARSEREGLRPCYFTDEELQAVYRDGRVNLRNAHVDWTSPGYRLLTETEWEKAARGGLEGQHFPWPSLATEEYESQIDASHANYTASGKGGTTAVGQYPANGYGLFDMAGNVFQWCWDGWDGHWYEQDDSTEADTRGPDVGSEGRRVCRGGGWDISAHWLRCACRYWGVPWDADDYRGFRLARGRSAASRAGERAAAPLARDEPGAASKRSSRGVLGKIGSWFGFGRERS